jgi:hypothetical protein
LPAPGKLFWARETFESCAVLILRRKNSAKSARNTSRFQAIKINIGLRMTWMCCAGPSRLVANPRRKATKHTGKVQGAGIFASCRID